MAEGRRSRAAEEPLDERYWDEWELYWVCGGFGHLSEEEWQKFASLVMESNKFGKLRMKEIHQEVRRADIRLLAGHAHSRAGRAIEAGQRVGYLACDLHGEQEHPCGSLRYRHRLGKVGSVYLDAQFLPSPCVGHDDDGSVSNLWFAQTMHIAPNVALRWEPVDDKRRNLLWMLVGRAARRIEGGEVLSVNPNDAAGNHSLSGEGRYLPQPTGAQAMQLRQLELPGVLGCTCHADCTAIVLDEDDEISDAEWRTVKTKAARMGVHLVGKRAGDSDTEQSSAGPAKILKRTARRDDRHFVKQEGAFGGRHSTDERRSSGTSAVQQHAGATAGGAPRRSSGGSAIGHSSAFTGCGTGHAGDQKTARVAARGSGVPPRGGGMARLRNIVKGGHASGEAVEGSVSGLYPLWLEPLVARATAQDILQSVFQNNAGTRRWIYARDPGLIAETGPGTVERHSGGVVVQFRSDDVCPGGQDPGTVLQLVAGVRDVCDSAAEIARRATREQGVGSGVGDAAAHARGVSVTDPGIAGGGAVSAQRVWADPAVFGAATVPTNDAGGLLVAGGATADRDPDHALDDAEAVAHGAPHPGPAARCDADSDRDTNVRQSRGDQEATTLRLLARPRRSGLSSVRGFGSDASSQAKAGSSQARTVSATHEGFQTTVLCGAAHQGLDSSARLGGFQRMHEAEAAGGAMSPLPAAVPQLSTRKRELASDVAAASLGGGQEGARACTLGRGPFLGDIYASGWHLTSSARTGAGTDPLLAERTRFGLRSSLVHGARGPTSALRDGASAASLIGSDGCDYGTFAKKQRQPADKKSTLTTEGLQPLTNGVYRVEDTLSIADRRRRARVTPPRPSPEASAPLWPPSGVQRSVAMAAGSAQREDDSSADAEQQTSGATSSGRRERLSLASFMSPAGSIDFRTLGIQDGETTGEDKGETDPEERAGLSRF